MHRISCCFCCACIYMCTHNIILTRLISRSKSLRVSMCVYRQVCICGAVIATWNCGCGSFFYRAPVYVWPGVRIVSFGCRRSARLFYTEGYGVFSTAWHPIPSPCILKEGMPAFLQRFGIPGTLPAKYFSDPCNLQDGMLAFFLCRDLEFLVHCLQTPFRSIWCTGRKACLFLTEVWNP